MQNQSWRFLNKVIAVAASGVLVASFSVFAAAQETRTPDQGVRAEALPSHAAPAARPGTVIVPASSIERPEDAGVRAHTNIKIFVPSGSRPETMNPENTFAEYPASIACVYKVGPTYAGCVPANNGDHATGGWGAIAVVDAYHNATAASDLLYFDTYFGVLPKATFFQIEANSSYGAVGPLGLTASCSGTPPSAYTYGWDVEESLDVQWAHAMAPSAKIILVEACSSSLNDLLVAEYVAGVEVAKYGGGDISNSWGTGDFSGEATYDGYFFRDYWKHTTYFASAGDAGGVVIYPSASPWVVSAGGTQIDRDASGNFLDESCWSSGGGGVSLYEVWQNPPSFGNGPGPWADYQYKLFGGAPYEFPGRATPDLSFDASPASGVWVYDSDSGTPFWYVVGGTSVSSPALAGIVNGAKQELGQAPAGGGFYFTAENDLLYSQLNTLTAYKANFYDVTLGSNGYSAGTGYDYCTGVGSPRGKLGK
jgi:subtilase family serine protease